MKNILKYCCFIFVLIFSLIYLAGCSSNNKNQKDSSTEPVIVSESSPVSSQSYFKQEKDPMKLPEKLTKIPTEDDFFDACKKANFMVTDITSQKDSQKVKKYLTSNDGVNYEISFVSYDSKDSAIQAYRYNQESLYSRFIENFPEATNKADSTDGNSTYFAYSFEENFFYVATIDNVIVVATSNNKTSKVVCEIIDYLN